jgi:CubicO group peptidase (beta-lactamase class C family)
MTLEAESLPAQAPASFAAASRVLQEAIADHAFPGCAYGICWDGQPPSVGALGSFTYDPGAPAVQPETIFDVASLTKVVSTTASAMLLVQRGVLDLDLPLAELLPGFVVGREPGSFARHLKIRHLLAHNSGLPGYVEFFKTHHTAKALLRACLELPIISAPGARAEYSDPGFILLGKALEVLTGEPLGYFADREIFKPLEMASSCYHPAPAKRPEIPPTENDAWFRNRVIQGEVQDENASVLDGCPGHAGVFSNVPDLLRFADEIVAATRSAGKLFEPDTITRFAQRQAPEGSSRALGWDTPSENSSSGTLFSKNSIGHLGYSGCSLWIDLDERVAVVLLTNRTWPDRKSDLIRKVRPAFHDAVRQSLQGPF